MFGQTHSQSHDGRSRARRPRLESLEDRLLLFAFNGGEFVYPQRITYSFVPDGTLFGNVPSTLNQAMANRGYATQTWEDQFRRAAAIWESKANVNLVEVPDDGSTFGLPGNQQSDPRFGDIRIGGFPLNNGTLAMAFLPPPINGGTLAGDILFNTSATWSIGGNYDVMTVALHEFGHDLGLDHSAYPSAVMYAYYNGAKSGPSADDTAGIQTLLGPRAPDTFEAASPSNSTYPNAANVTGSIDGNLQVNLPNLDITTSNPNEWFYVKAPAGTTGTMQVTMQSSALSSLSPRLMVYSGGLSILGQANSSAFGATVTVTIPNVTAGQGFYIRTLTYGGAGNTGNYGLGVNFGSVPLAPFTPPNTTVPEQPDQGGGGEAMHQIPSLAQLRGNPASLRGTADQLTVDGRWARALPGNRPDQVFACNGFDSLNSLALSWLQPLVALVTADTAPAAGSQAPANPPKPLLQFVDLIDSVLANWDV